MGTYDTIRYAAADGVATLTLNRPDKLNACTTQMIGEIIAALDQADRDDSVRAIIFTGEGRAFCAGADLSAGTASFNPNLPEQFPYGADGRIDYSDEAMRDLAGRLTLRLFNCLKPVIGAVNGPAVGVGATMLLAMDIRLASTEARFGFIFTRVGLVPEGAAAFFLPRIVGISKALEWCYTARVFSAREALDGGLVSRLCAPEELSGAACSLAREIADTAAPVSVALTRQMMWRGLGMRDPMDAHKIDSRAIASRSRSADVAEGVAAFIAKRTASFPDRVSMDMPDFIPWWNEERYS